MDEQKIINFIEAAISNPKHPAYPALLHSRDLQHYAINVKTLGAIKPEQWVKDYPESVARITQVIEVLEAGEKEAPEAVAVGKAEYDALAAKVADLEAKIKKEAPVSDDEPIEPSGEEN